MIWVALMILQRSSVKCNVKENQKLKYSFLILSKVLSLFRKYISDGLLSSYFYNYMKEIFVYTTMHHSIWNDLIKQTGIFYFEFQNQGTKTSLIRLSSTKIIPTTIKGL